jgi:multidrug resistance protein
MCTPAAPQILAEIAPNASKVYINIVVSIWELGEAFGPLLVAPLSEVYGRYPIYHTANVLFIVFSAASALSTNIGMLVAFRFFNGIAVASVTLNSSIVGDMFMTEERGKAMAIMGIAPLLGPLSGPLIGGYMSQAIGWRWIFWFITIFAGFLELVFILVFRETYKVKILKIKVAKHRKASGDQYQSSLVGTTVTKQDFLQQVLIRPARMLFLSPMIFLLALNVATVFGYFYLFLTSITEVFQNIYHFSTGSAGLTFLGMGNIH